MLCRYKKNAFSWNGHKACYNLPMYKVMIVEDNVPTLDNLSRCLDWREHGFDTVTCFPSSLDAWDSAKKMKYDIVISDIRMPDMDGIDLLTRIRQLHPDTCFVLLTAFHEFEYAKRAIELGVMKFLLKPVNIQELKRTVSQAVDVIAHKSVQTSSTLRDQVLMEWLSGACDPFDLSVRAGMAGINLYMNSYCVILVKPIYHIGMFGMLNNKLFVELSKEYDVWNTQTLTEASAFILGGRIDTFRVQKIVEKEVEKNEYSSLAIAAIGSIAKDSGAVHASYNAALGVIKSSMFYKPGDVIVLAENYENVYTRHEGEWRKVLAEQDDAQARSLSVALLHDIIEAHKNTPSHLRLLIIQTLLDMARHVDRAMVTACCDRIMQERLKELDTLRTRHELEKMICDSINEMRYLLQNHNMLTSCRPIVKLAVDFIYKNYAHAISLSRFSETCHSSAAYIGRVFKADTTLSFNDFLNNVRINRSKELLMNTNMPIADIAKSIGFDSESYFYRCFKKINGISPAAYRKFTEG